MSTTSKEECITSINEFLVSHSFESAMKLLTNYLEDQDEKAIAQVLSLVNQNPSMLNLAMPKVLKELEIRYSLNEVSKNNNPILVY